jgi:hypothetical protein
MRLARLSTQKELTRKERLELQWLKRNRSHETFVYLNKLHAIEHSQDRLLSSKATNKPAPDASVDKGQALPKKRPIWVIVASHAQRQYLAIAPYLLG